MNLHSTLGGLDQFNQEKPVEFFLDLRAPFHAIKYMETTQNKQTIIIYYPAPSYTTSSA